MAGALLHVTKARPAPCQACPHPLCSRHSPTAPSPQSWQASRGPHGESGSWPALPARGCATPARLADARATRAAGSAPDAACARGPLAPPTPGRAAGRPAPAPPRGVHQRPLGEPGRRGVLALGRINRGRVHETGRQAAGIRQGVCGLELLHCGGGVALREGLHAGHHQAFPAPLLGRHGAVTLPIRQHASSAQCRAMCHRSLLAMSCSSAMSMAVWPSPLQGNPSLTPISSDSPTQAVARLVLRPCTLLTQKIPV
jgi:hypothetical protein